MSILNNDDLPTSWSPERKVMGAATATLILVAVQLIFGIDPPPGTEGAIAVIAAYWIRGER